MQRDSWEGIETQKLQSVVFIGDKKEVALGIIDTKWSLISINIKKKQWSWYPRGYISWRLIKKQSMSAVLSRLVDMITRLGGLLSGSMLPIPELYENAN